MTTVFTVCTAAQFPYAEALQNSLPQSVNFKVGIIGGQIDDEDAVHISTLQIPDWEAMSQRYDEAALVAASKPFFTKYFLQNSDEVIYFDPTIWVLTNLNPILSQLKESEIVITPRVVQPFGVSDYADEKFFLNSGLIDSGFYALKNTKQVFELLGWWQKRVVENANLDLCNAQNHDQLWLMFLPAFYENVAIVKNKSWNVGLQNLHERTLTKIDKSWFVNQSEELFFINFREITNSKHQDLIKKSGVGLLFEEYKKEVDGLPQIFSLVRSQRKELSYWKKRLINTLSSIVHKIDTFPIFITDK